LSTQPASSVVADKLQRSGNCLLASQRRGKLLPKALGWQKKSLSMSLANYDFVNQ